MKNYNRHRQIVRGFFFASLICIFLSGCYGKKRVEKDPFFEKWKTTAESAKGYSPTDQRHIVEDPEKKEMPVEQQTVDAAPDTVEEAPARQLPTDKITMKMNDIDVAVLLRALARAANQNIIINEKVKGKTSINITRANWDEVFQGILNTHGLTYAWQGEIIRIMTAEDMNEDLKREAQKIGLKQVAPPATRIIPVDYAKAEDLKINLENFLSQSKEGKVLGSVMVDAHTNSLIIQALPGDIDRMIPIIEALDKPTPQILIEAHIVEASKNVARDLGIQWGGLYKHTTGDGVNHYFTNDAGAGTGVDLDTRVNPASGFLTNFPVAGVLPGGPGFALGYIAENLGTSIITAQLTALQTEGKLNILSSPSITTVDNRVAKIESGTKIPYQTVEDGEVKIEYKDASLKLEVIPHVVDGKTLNMYIKVTKDEPDFARQVQGQPTIISKFAETNVNLRDGQTTVIGGLNKEKTQDSESGVPFLKDIPILGYLFKGTGKKNEFEDLLIFITPHILEEYKNPESKNEPVKQMIPLKSPDRPDPEMQ
ncbi:MAG: type IV pilus secretin PilQ [Pseudomonadota bacterium]